MAAAQVTSKEIEQLLPVKNKTKGKKRAREEEEEKKKKNEAKDEEDAPPVSKKQKQAEAKIVAPSVQKIRKFKRGQYSFGDKVDITGKSFKLARYYSNEGPQEFAPLFAITKKATVNRSFGLQTNQEGTKYVLTVDVDHQPDIDGLEDQYQELQEAGVDNSRNWFPKMRSEDKKKQAEMYAEIRRNAFRTYKERQPRLDKQENIIPGQYWSATHKSNFVENDLRPTDKPRKTHIAFEGEEPFETIEAIQNAGINGCKIKEYIWRVKWVTIAGKKYGQSRELSRLILYKKDIYVPAVLSDDSCPEDWFERLWVFFFV